MKAMPTAPCHCKEERQGDLAFFLIMSALSIGILIVVAIAVHDRVSTRPATSSTCMEAPK